MEMEVATKMLSEVNEGSSEHDPIDAHYQKLKTDVIPLEYSDPAAEMIRDYMKKSHAATHSDYRLKVTQVHRIERHGEQKKFKKFEKFENRQLLWHGSRTTNFVGILSQGLRIAPSEAPDTGYMFGKGIYFADRVSKSANYCFPSRSTKKAKGLLLLSEVALGKCYERLSADYIEKLPPGYHSTKGVGRTAPGAFTTMDDGVIVPMGDSITTSDKPSTLLYNEFIVYNTDQVCLRYLVEVEFDFKF